MTVIINIFPISLGIIPNIGHFFLIQDELICIYLTIYIIIIIIYLCHLITYYIKNAYGLLLISNKLPQTFGCPNLLFSISSA